ncbi:MAG: 30S ribosomal protein S15 [Gammaproteobacteria bacterium]
MIDSSAKAEIISQYQRAEGDTGSTEVQVALLSARISRLTEHMKQFKKDFHTRLGLLKIVSKRNKLLKYLKKTDVSRYRTLIGQLKIRDKY